MVTSIKKAIASLCCNEVEEDRFQRGGNVALDCWELFSCEIFLLTHFPRPSPDYSTLVTTHTRMICKTSGVNFIAQFTCLLCNTA
jgi:hypothetical protein